MKIAIKLFIFLGLTLLVIFLAQSFWNEETTQFNNEHYSYDHESVNQSQASVDENSDKNDDLITESDYESDLNSDESASSQSSEYQIMNEDGEIVSTVEHDENLDILENEEFQKYDEGKINFALLRQTKLFKDPPPIFPDALNPLDGQTVEIIGFMAPYDSLNDMTNFMLMPVSVGCYFCVPPSAKEVVLVRQDVEGEAPYESAPIVVKGQLSLWKDKSDDPAHEMFLYVLDNASISVYQDDSQP